MRLYSMTRSARASRWLFFVFPSSRVGAGGVSARARSARKAAGFLIIFKRYEASDLAPLQPALMRPG